MARRKSPTLTDAELRLMEVLWDRGPSTVGDVAQGLPGESPLAYTTVLTTLRILERKGYVKHQRKGRAFVYRPLIAKEQAQSSAVRYMLSRFFGNSRELLLLRVLEDEELDAGERERLKRMIEESE
jgi:predicted transcriptional regulator